MTVPEVCGLRRCELTPDGFWHNAEPTCVRPTSYEVHLHDDWIPLCPEHTAWARANWSSVSSVRTHT